MKAVTDTKYYDEIAYTMGIYGRIGLKPSQMAEEITKIVSDRESYGEERGREAQYNEFWDKYLHQVMNGGAANYLFGGVAWNGDTFYPPAVTIKPKSNVDGMFNRFSWGKSPYIDLAKRLQDCGCVLDFSENTYSFGGTFTYCYVTRLPKLDFSATTYDLDRTFDNARFVITIDEIVMPTAGVAFPNTFRRCDELANIVITGTIAKSISFADSSKLTSASVDSIIRALEKLSTGESAKSLTLHSTVKNKLTATQIATIQEKGWTLA